MMHFFKFYVTNGKDVGKSFRKEVPLNFDIAKVKEMIGVEIKTDADLLWIKAENSNVLQIQLLHNQ